MKKTILAVLLLCFFCTSIATAQIYKWRDENGKMHFSDTPPVTKQDVKSITVRDNAITVDSQGVTGDEPKKEIKAVNKPRTKSDKLNAKSKESGEELAFDVITDSFVSGRVDDLTGSTVIPLANGQVWKQSSPYQALGYFEGARARVLKSLLSA